MFIEFRKQKLGKVTFGDNGRSNILGIDKIGKDSTNSIDYVDLVDGLKYNLLSISQLCDKGYCVWFDGSQCAIENMRSNDIILHGSKLDNVYVKPLSYLSYASFLSENIH